MAKRKRPGRETPKRVVAGRGTGRSRKPPRPPKIDSTYTDPDPPPPPNNRQPEDARSKLRNLRYDFLNTLWKHSKKYMPLVIAALLLFFFIFACRKLGYNFPKDLLSLFIDHLLLRLVLRA